MGHDLEARLRYLYLDGTKAALRKLGWEYRKGEGPLHVWTKKVQEITEPIVLRTISKAFTRTQVRITLDAAEGIKYEDFEAAYIQFYDGAPPPMPM